MSAVHWVNAEHEDEVEEELERLDDLAFAELGG